MVHTWPQTSQKESIAKPGTLMLIILSLVHKSDLKVHCPIRYSKKKKKSADGNIR